MLLALFGQVVCRKRRGLKDWRTRILGKTPDKPWPMMERWPRLAVGQFQKREGRKEGRTGYMVRKQAAAVHESEWSLFTAGGNSPLPRSISVLVLCHLKPLSSL